ncbi:Sterol 3-beta-glucosyltransferase [Fusarium oxysporum f. sp. cubense race 1]|uniref:Sterol 3-beta-glucosyltransferase n=1 Tax=Fusarium oxysporum f. sp. cubense (strain race 1) TaxID=1229664 RepID=N4TWJ4_FUSC1|nr:Sterol 3-beta-glucosyltransferase [Fusarium oxysporum f. sp. cubense race 1]
MSQYTDYYQYEGNLAEATLQQQPTLSHRWSKALAPQPRPADSEPFTTKLNIVIQVVGSRGDVQPFVALGTELKRHGHRVRLATHNTFESFVHDSGLEFYPIGGDPTELMAYMVRNPGLIPSVQSLKAGDIGKKRIMVEEMLRGCWLSCVNPDPITFAPFVADAIIANPPSFAHVHCAQALGIPLHMMFTMPWTSTAAFPHPLVNVKFGRVDAAEQMKVNYLSYGVVEVLTWQGLGDIINKWRATLDLEDIAFSQGPRLTEKLDIPFTYCWSPALVPKPRDWSENVDVCGFFFRDPPDYTPPPALAEFLRDGPTPIYIGFGSIVIDDPNALSHMLLEAIRITGTRALISRGWSKLDGPQSDNVMFLGDCPHEWLFQRVSAVMHHGGAGTTACGLLYGKPTTIVPFFGDQPFWGKMVASAGAGPEPIPQKAITVGRLVEAIEFCSTPQAAEAAASIASKMQSENGVKQAVASFHKHLRPYVVECDIIKGRPAVWEYSRRRNTIKLSKLAADILMTHLKIDGNKLKQIETRKIIIETRRWDPLTGVLAAVLGATTDVTRAAESRSCVAVTKSAALAFVLGLGTLVKAVATAIVEIPFAFTEGLWQFPRLWGHQVRDFGVIRDWKAGLATWLQVLGFAFYDGFTGLFVQPYRGAKEDGPLGVFKGIAKAIANLHLMLLAAAVGTGAYPLRGIHQSILYLISCKTRRSIQLARRLEGRYLAGKAGTDRVLEHEVLDSFDKLMRREIRAAASIRMASEGPGQNESRRTHRKSKAGCVTCKRRHVKCDEGRPRCAKCALGNRSCSYASTPQQAGLSPNAAVAAVASTSASNNSPALTSSSTDLLTAAAAVGTEPTVRYDAVHMTLLHHAILNMGQYLGVSGDMSPVLDTALESAHTAPYCLDQLLAVSALYQSTTAQARKHLYIRYATELQTRALGQFLEARGNISESNFVPAFLFTSLVGVHVLHNTFRDHQDNLGEFVSAFVDYARVHRGIRAVTADYWDQILASNLASLLGIVELGNRIDHLGAGTETKTLREHLESLPDASRMAVTASIDALKRMQWVLDLANHNAQSFSNRIQATLAWPIIISDDYIDALYLRNPEAMAVLAFYLAFVYQIRSFWIFESCKASLIEALASYLGPFWKGSISWPLSNIPGS